MKLPASSLVTAQASCILAVGVLGAGDSRATAGTVDVWSCGLMLAELLDSTAALALKTQVNIPARVGHLLSASAQKLTNASLSECSWSW